MQRHPGGWRHPRPRQCAHLGQSLRARSPRRGANSAARLLSSLSGISPTFTTRTPRGLAPTHCRAAAARFGLRASRLPRRLLLRGRKASSRSAKSVPDPWGLAGLSRGRGRPMARVSHFLVPCAFTPRSKACLGRKRRKGQRRGPCRTRVGQQMIIYLFQDETDSEIFAFSIDVTGANLPLVSPHTEWIFLEALDTLKFPAPWDIGDFQEVLDHLTGTRVLPLPGRARRPIGPACPSPACVGLLSASWQRPPLDPGSASARVGGTGDCDSSTAELTLNGELVDLAIAKMAQARAERCVEAQSCTQWLNPAAQHGPAPAVPTLLQRPLRRPGQRCRQC